MKEMLQLQKVARLLALFTLVLTLIGGAPSQMQARSDNLTAQSGFAAQVRVIKKEMEALVDARLQELQKQARNLEKNNFPVDDQLKTLRQISLLEAEFGKDEQSALTDKKRIELLKNSPSEAHKKELIDMTLAHAYSRAHYQTPEQEKECKRTLEPLLTDVAGSDPCLQVQVLSRWIGWFPWLFSVRAQLIEALPRCTETGIEADRIKMSGYLWASGYQYTNHILYQPPKLPQLLQKAYEFAVLARDPDAVLRIVNMIDGTSIWAKGFSSHSSDVALNQTSPMSKSAQLILMLKMLEDSANHDGGKFQIVSNLIRNEIVSYALEADPIEIKKVMEAWLSILVKVPSEPEGFPEDSGSEIMTAHLIMGTIETMLGNYDRSREWYKTALAEASAIAKIGSKSIDLAKWKEQAMLRVKRLLNEDVSADPYAFAHNPFRRLQRLQYAHDHFSTEFTSKVQTAANVGLAVIDAKQHKIEDAKSMYKKLAESDNEENDGETSHLKAARSNLAFERKRAGIEALIANELAPTNPTEAASCFRQAWDAYDKSRPRAAYEFALDNFRRGIDRPEWPPRTIPPTRGMPRSDSEEIVMRVLPDEKQLRADYSAFLKKHTEIAGSADQLKQLEAQDAHEKELDAKHEIANKLYAIDNEENQIANLTKTDPDAAIEQLRGIIAKRREVGNDQSRLINSLCALGHELSDLGLVKEARPPLEQALKLSEQLEGDKQKAFQVQPNLYMGETFLQSGDWSKANELISKAIAKMDSDKLEIYTAASARLSLAICLVEQGNFKAAESCLAQAEKPFKSDLHDPDYSFEAEVARIKALMYLSMKDDKRAIGQSHASTKFLEQAAENFTLNERDQIDDQIIKARCNLAENNLDQAAKDLDRADDLLKKLPGNSNTLLVQICEARAMVASSRKNWPDAQAQYQKALDVLTEKIGSCPRVDKIREALNALSAQ
jgi:hypothetical protein